MPILQYYNIYTEINCRNRKERHYKGQSEKFMGNKSYHTVANPSQADININVSYHLHYTVLYCYHHLAFKQLGHY
jgi:hypothetical protein